MHCGWELANLNFSSDIQVGGFVSCFTRRCHLLWLMLYFLTWLGTCQFCYHHPKAVHIVMLYNQIWNLLEEVSCSDFV